MEEKAKKKENNSSSLKHRFAHMLLGSSCTASATTATTTSAKFVKLSSPLHHVRKQAEAHSDCVYDKRLTQHRRKPNRSTTESSVAGAYGNCFTPRVAPTAQVPLRCVDGRHSIHTSEPLASRTQREEKSNLRSVRKLTESAKFNQAFSSEEKKLSAASPFPRTPRNLGHRSDRGEEAKKNKNTSDNRCKTNIKETMKLSSNAYGFSRSSSFDSGNDLDFCTSDEEEEESPSTLFSFKSFSSDSSEFYQNSRKMNNRTNKENNISTSMKSTLPSPRPMRGATKPRRRHSWDAGDNFRPLVSHSSSKAEKQVEAAAETKATAARGLAVVKKSSDPYMDFRSSMVEMIVKRNIRSAKDLKGLLQSYLSLNAARHHPAIVEAFSDIWNAIFCCSD